MSVEDKIRHYWQGDGFKEAVAVARAVASRGGFTADAVKEAVAESGLSRATLRKHGIEVRQENETKSNGVPPELVARVRELLSGGVSVRVVAAQAGLKKCAVEKIKKSMSGRTTT